MLRLVLVDDDADDVYFFEQACRSLSFELESIVLRDGAELYDFVIQGAGQSSLILLDLNMPGTGGFEVLSRLKREDLVSQLIICAYTTSVHLHDVNLSYQLGVKTYVPKPNTVPDLTELLAELVKYWGEIAMLPESPLIQRRTRQTGGGL